MTVGLILPTFICQAPVNLKPASISSFSKKRGPGSKPHREPFRVQGISEPFNCPSQVDAELRFFLAPF